MIMYATITAAGRRTWGMGSTRPSLRSFGQACRKAAHHLGCGGVRSPGEAPLVMHTSVEAPRGAYEPTKQGTRDAANRSEHTPAG
jgi:hypothetical protein